MHAVCSSSGESNVENIRDETARYLKEFSFLAPHERAQLRRAHAYMSLRHQGQRRDSGEPFATHPRQMSLIALSEFGIKDLTIHLACLGHDLIEDTSTPLEVLVGIFGVEAAGIILHVSIPGKTNGSHSSELQKKLYYSSLFRAPWKAQTVAVLDCLHNLRTLSGSSEMRRARTLWRAHTVCVPLVSWFEALQLCYTTAIRNALLMAIVANQWQMFWSQFFFSIKIGTGKKEEANKIEGV